MVPKVRHFKPKEFLCRCGECSLTYQNMDATFVKLLEAARKRAGVPFKLTSALRCEDHNKAVGGVPNSAHVRGMAVDVAATNSATRWQILDGAYAVGFGRIGIGSTFIHLDRDPDKPTQVVWLYD